MQQTEKNQNKKFQVAIDEVASDKRKTISFLVQCCYLFNQYFFLWHFVLALRSRTKFYF